MKSWMASEFEMKDCEGITCPECSENMEYDDVQKAASSATFEAYDKLATRNALGALDECAWCLNAGCGSGQLNDNSRNYMDCDACGYKQCTKHNVQWHSGETCEQYEYRKSGQKARDDEERKTLEILDAVFKKCPGPNCGWKIQKNAGCDLTKCRRCKHKFCWLCLASNEEIHLVGNTAHAITCEYHSYNLELRGPFTLH